MKRILLVASGSLSRVAELQLALLTHGLSADDFDLHLCLLGVAPALLGRLHNNRLTCHTVGRRPTFDAAGYRTLKRLISQLRPDVLHAWGFTAGAFGRLAAWNAGITNTVHSDPDHSPRGLCSSLLETRLAKRTKASVVESDLAFQLAVCRGVSPQQLRLIAPGAPRLAASQTSRDEILRRLNLPSTARLVMTQSPLVERQRIKDLIWAADLLKVIRDDMHLLILGAGPQQGRLQRFRDLCRVEDQVHFVGQRATADELWPHVKQFWSASEGEPTALPLLEPLAAGVPIIATQTAAHAQLLVHGRNGFLVPVGDRAGFCKFAQRMLEDESLRQRIATAGRQTVLEQLPADQMVAKHATLYRELSG